MKINLLPIIPKTRRFKFPIFLLVAVLVLGASGLVAIDVYQKLGEYNAEKTAYERIAADLEQAEQNLAVSRAESKVFIDYYREFNDVQKNNYDVTLIFDAIAGLLPAQGYISMLSLSGDDYLSLNIEFPKVLTSSQAIQIFDDTPWVEEIRTVDSSFESGRTEMLLLMKINIDTLLEGSELDE